MSSHRLLPKLMSRLLCGAVPLLAACGPPSEAPRPHIFLITADALRADHLSVHGYYRETSPRIDEFARAAWNLRDAITVIPKTGPSFTTMFTGRHPEEHGVRFNGTRPPRELPLLAERLRSAGYRTAAFVSNVVLRAQMGYSRGFETYEMLDPADGTASVNYTFLEWAQRDWKEPTFVWLHYIDPHGPYTPPEEFEALFIDDRWGQSGRRAEVHPRKKKVLGAIPNYQARDGETSVDKYIAWYDAEIRYVDSAFGEVIDFLRGHELYDGSVVVFTSDHGESLGEHDFYFEHGWYAYEPSLRIPWIIKVPGQRTGKTLPDAVSNLDFLPTLLSVAGLPSDERAQGANVLGPLPERGGVVVESSDNYPEKYYGFRSPGTKYVFRESDRREELYDLRADPGETRNFASEEPQTLAALANACNEALQELRAGAGASASALAPSGDSDDHKTPEVLKNLRALGYLD